MKISVLEILGVIGHEGPKGTPNTTGYFHWYQLPMITRWINYLLMKTPLSLNVGHEEINLELTLILSPSLHSSRNVLCSLLGEKRHQWPYPTLDATCFNTNLLARYAYCNSSMTVMKATNKFLIGHEACLLHKGDILLGSENPVQSL